MFHFQLQIDALIICMLWLKLLNKNEHKHYTYNVHVVSILTMPLSIEHWALTTDIHHYHNRADGAHEINWRFLMRLYNANICIYNRTRWQLNPNDLDAQFRWLWKSVHESVCVFELLFGYTCVQCACGHFMTEYTVICSRN